MQDDYFPRSLNNPGFESRTLEFNFLLNTIESNSSLGTYYLQFKLILSFFYTFLFFERRIKTGTGVGMTFSMENEAAGAGADEKFSIQEGKLGQAPPQKFRRKNEE